MSSLICAEIVSAQISELISQSQHLSTGRVCYIGMTSFTGRRTSIVYYLVGQVDRVYMIITELSLDDYLRRVIAGIHIHTCAEFLASCWG